MKILEPYNIVKPPADEKSLQNLQATLYRYCLALTRSRYEAEDLAQDTWTKALGYGKFVENPNPEALLLRIAKNTWIDTGRRKASLVRILERGQALTETNSGPASGERISEIEMAFQALINHLSPLQRTAFVMRDVLEYSACETAEALETTEGAVKAALHRARQALRAVRQELSENEGPAAPQDIDFRLWLRALADSYVKGQIPVMLELLRQEKAAEMTMAVSSGTVQAQYYGRSFSTRKNSSQPEMVMAA